jgi:hypothetical protein
MKVRLAIALLSLAGCYTNGPATRDVSAAWRGRTNAEIEARWGAPATRTGDGSSRVLVWAYRTTHVELPGVSASITERPVTAGATVTGPGGSGAVVVQGTAIDVAAAFRPGMIWQTTTEAAALIDGARRITQVEGAALHWGPPNDANLHWGTIFGGHVGFGRLDTTPTPLPSGGAYLGGMLGPTLGLVGTFSLVAGSSSAGSAMGMSGGAAAQWWPINRVWLRAGPAMLLTFDPGFTHAGLHPGVTTGASYAFVKVGVLAIDLRLDMTAGPSTAFGTLGVGVNVN